MSDLITYAFCYDDSYARGNPCAALGVRGHDVRITHICDEGARSFIRQSKGQVIPKLDGYRKADEVRELTRMWVRDFGERIPVIALADEPTANGITVAQMVEMAKAIREVTDKPIVANLMADAENVAYAFALAPYITYLSTDAYCNANGDCSYVNTEKTVRAAGVWLADVFKAAGMNVARGQGVMFIAQGFRMTRCVGELQARSVVFGDALYEMYLRVFDETLGGLLKGVGIYAWLNEDKTGSDGEMPSLHEEMWPPIKRFFARLDGMPAPQPQAQKPPDIVIEGRLTEFTFFVAQDRYARDAEFEVAVDGVALKKNVRVDAKAIRKNDVWQRIIVRHTASQSKHTLTIRFTNDAYDGPGKDLNLYVRGATQDGVAMKGLSAGALYYPGQSATFETTEVA